MKIDRLIGILSILLQKEKVTAPFLAERFEVSRRTINRDIEDICRAGIPIITEQGKNGGISIASGYKIDKSILTSSEMQAILAGLRGLDSVSGTNRYRMLMDKLYVEKSSVMTSDYIAIDLSSWYKNELSPKIDLIKSAIEETEKIGFSYFSPKGESSRIVEPYMLVFHWSSWYVWGFCTGKNDYRLFKLNRMINLSNTGLKFEKRSFSVPDFSYENIYPYSFNVKILFDSSYKWRLVDEFGIDSFTEQEDGKLLFSFGFTDKENLFGWLLSFGSKAELLEPKEFRRELCDFACEMQKKYLDFK